MKEAVKGFKIGWDLRSRIITVTNSKAGDCSIVSFSNNEKIIELIGEPDSEHTKEARLKTFNWFSMLTFKDYKTYYLKYGIKIMKVNLN